MSRRAPTEGACAVAEVVRFHWHTVQHVLQALRDDGAKGTDAELIERFQHLIAAIVTTTVPMPIEPDPFTVHGTQ